VSSDLLNQLASPYCQVTCIRASYDKEVIALQSLPLARKRCTCNIIFIFCLILLLVIFFAQLQFF